MTDFRDRLRRLRREPATSASTGMERAPLPDSLRRRLSRDGVVSRQSGPYPGAMAGTAVGMPRDLVESQGQAGYFAARESHVAAEAKHGEFALDEVFDADPATLRILTGDDSLADVDLERAVFFDTETTGLSGGAGTYVFMIGLGVFDAGRFRVWQGFLREPCEEPALLQEAADRIAAGSVLVSFFGKSFDRHRLQDKMRIAGVEPPFESLPHLDLYHPLQRLTKGVYVDGRLSTLEHELCGLVRDDDLPGAFAPEAWFEFLSGRPHLLERVFQHNLDDVLSLVTLAAYAGRAVAELRRDGTELAGCGCVRARALYRAYRDLGDAAAARRWRDAARERDDPASVRDLDLEVADDLRREGALDEAKEAYGRLLDGTEDRYAVRALIQLAKLYEHGLRDPESALGCCEDARRIAELELIGAERRRFAADLQKRVARLQRLLL